MALWQTSPVIQGESRQGELFDKIGGECILQNLTCWEILVLRYIVQETTELKLGFSYGKGVKMTSHCPIIYCLADFHLNIGKKIYISLVSHVKPCLLYYTLP